MATTLAATCTQVRLFWVLFRRDLLLLALFAVVLLAFGSALFRLSLQVGRKRATPS